MDKKGWKIIAIIFIVLFALETLLGIWVIGLGTQVIENENDCAYNICSDYETYYYDNYEQMCYCYNNHEVEYQEYIR